METAQTSGAPAGSVDPKRALEETIAEYRRDPIDLLDIGDGPGETRYLETLKPTYERTIADITTHFAEETGRAGSSKIRLLELGAFLGVVSIALARSSFSVTALDLPEFMNNAKLQSRLRSHGVECVPNNLRSYALPLDAGRFDAVVMCETLEHLNFNPLPVLAEINRVLRDGGILYLSLPNQARLASRLGLLRGRSIHNPISDFFAQLDPTTNMSVGLHWREYTGDEIRTLLERLGFEVVRQYFFEQPSRVRGPRSAISAVVKSLFPRLRENQTTIARKKGPAPRFGNVDAGR